MENNVCTMERTTVFLFFSFFFLERKKKEDSMLDYYNAIIGYLKTLTRYVELRHAEIL